MNFFIDILQNITIIQNIKSIIITTTTTIIMIIIIIIIIKILSQLKY